ncbi:YidH family protein [Salirhabdus salicampi]|uniref:YidH family protein n=1 Tax=Salirhabdus salicampi TaxID=476102 RepID=UPI0020C2BF13|nr:DUF202 domain-containing protein [Salirhabdus salicampi]MCP8616243.1 DUF202 domain-containing protein [Salirhabdus salicampi]
MNKDVDEARYSREHLANERTFLAWLRTAIATMGVGFIASVYHFQMNIYPSRLGDIIALLIGLSSLLLSILTVCFALYSYFTKRKQINKQMFRSSNKLLVIITLFILILSCLYVIYLIVVYSS